MSTDDRSLALIRGTRSYRAAVWLTRFNHLPALAAWWSAFTIRPTLNAVTTGLLILLTVGILGAFALLRRAGVPLPTQLQSWSAEDRQLMARELILDVYRPRRPKP